MGTGRTLIASGVPRQKVAIIYDVGVSLCIRGFLQGINKVKDTLCTKKVKQQQLVAILSIKVVLS